MQREGDKQEEEKWREREQEVEGGAGEIQREIERIYGEGGRDKWKGRLFYKGGGQGDEDDKYRYRGEGEKLRDVKEREIQRKQIEKERQKGKNGK